MNDATGFGRAHEAFFNRLLGYPAFTAARQYRRPSAGGRLAMAPTARDPFIAYLLIHATMLRGHQAAPAAAALLAEHVNALELLVDVVRDLPEDDERLLMLVTLAVRHG